MSLFLQDWVDEWADLSDIQPPDLHKCISAGLLVPKNEKWKILIMPTVEDTDHRGNSHVDAGVMIPVSAILKLKRLISCP
jgi:hypothetical protein